MKRKQLTEALVMDIDGTLTPPRQPMHEEMADALAKLKPTFFLAAGSDLPLVKNQFFDPLKKFNFKGSVEAFINNGASHFHCDYAKAYKIIPVKKFDIQKHLGNRNYKRLLTVLTDTMKTKQFMLPASIKVTGKQIIERGSMVNFAPIGRPVNVSLTKANLDSRKKFVEFDVKTGYRTNVMNHLKAQLSDLMRDKDLSFMYGGQTSFDIVIKGMDKTNPIKILLKRGYQRIVFLGDALFKGGNDSVVMDFIKEWDGPRPCPVMAIKVESWQNTIDQFKANGWID